MNVWCEYAKGSPIPAGLGSIPELHHNAWWVKRPSGRVMRYGLGSASGDLSSMNASLDSANGLLTAGNYPDAITTYKAAGQNAVTTLGPEIDAQTGSASVSFTQQAWVLNDALASISGTAQVDAESAQAIAGQMRDLYTQGLATSAFTANTLPSTPLVQAAADLNGYFATNPCTQSAFTQASDFQTAYNAAGMGPAINVDGKYGPLTRAALQHVMTASGSGTAPRDCFTATTVQSAVATTNPYGASTTKGAAPRNWTPVILTSAGVAAAGVIGYAYWYKYHRRRR